MTTKTIRLTVDINLLARLDKATKRLGVERTKFVEEALELALRRSAIAEMERRYRAGYRQHPVKPGEFDVWENEQAWGDA